MAGAFRDVVRLTSLSRRTFGASAVLENRRGSGSAARRGRRCELGQPQLEQAAPRAAARAPPRAAAPASALELRRARARPRPARARSRALAERGARRRARRSISSTAAKRATRSGRSASSRNAPSGSPTARRTPALEVARAAVGIEQHAARRVERQRVHGEVAPVEVLERVVGERHLVGLPRVGVLALAAERRALEPRAVVDQRAPCRALADRLDAREAAPRTAAGVRSVATSTRSAPSRPSSTSRTVPPTSQARPAARAARERREQRGRPRVRAQDRLGPRRAFSAGASCHAFTAPRSSCCAAALAGGCARPAALPGPRPPRPIRPVALPPAGVRAWQVGLRRPDRLQHAGLSFTLAAGATLVSASPLASFTGTLALGLAKEIWDSRHGSFDAVDLAADAAGAALGASVAGARR